MLIGVVELGIPFDGFERIRFETGARVGKSKKKEGLRDSKRSSVPRNDWITLGPWERRPYTPFNLHTIFRYTTTTKHVFVFENNPKEYPKMGGTFFLP